MSDEKALMVSGATVAVYGESGDVAALQQRIMTMLPQVAKIGPQAAYGLAQVSLAMGLNPFIGEIWAIPDGKGGYGIQGGIKGIRRSAHREAKSDGGMYTVEHRLPTAEELEGLILNKGDITRACDLYLSGKRAESFRVLTGKMPKFTGIGIYRNGEKTRMNPLQCVRKRAEADVLKQAFDLPLAYGEQHEDVDFVEPGPYDPDYVPTGDATTATQAADELFGEYTSDGDQPINGEIVEEPTDEPPPQAEQPAVNWTADDDIMKRFWVWAGKQKIGDVKITHGQVREALGVDSVRKYAGTVGEAKTAVLSWIKAQPQPEQVPA